MHKKYYFHSFKYCPVCGAKYKKTDFNNKDALFICNKCGFQFYQNKAPTTSLIIPSKNNPLEILLVTRNIEPHKGKLDIPGGFMKFEESPQIAIKREIYEELGFKPKIKELFNIELTHYEYKKSLYLHTTIYYIAEPIQTLPKIKDKFENSNVEFKNLINLKKFKNQLSFKSDYKTLQKYIKRFS